MHSNYSIISGRERVVNRMERVPRKEVEDESTCVQIFQVRFGLVAY